MHMSQSGLEQGSAGSAIGISVPGAALPRPEIPASVASAHIQGSTESPKAW